MNFGLVEVEQMDLLEGMAGEEEGMLLLVWKMVLKIQVVVEVIIVNYKDGEMVDQV